MGLFDAISGIFKRGTDFITDFGGGAFAAIDERLRGGTLTPGAAADRGFSLGAGVGNLFGDIGESFLTARVGGGGGLTTGAGRVGVGATSPPPVGGGFGGPLVVGGRLGQPPPPPTIRATAPTLPAGATTIGHLLPFIGGGLGPAAGAMAGVQQIVRGIETFGPAIGKAVEHFFLGEDDMAQALPGGAPVNGGGAVAQVPGFSFSQNLSTGVTRATPKRLLMAMNPMTGNPTFWTHAGRPVLFSGDLATCKRVDRIAARARRRRPR